MTTEIIHKEHFEHWLFSQEDSRTFKFTDSLECMCCGFVRETTSVKQPMFADTFWFTEIGGSVTAMPQWLVDVIAGGRRNAMDRGDYSAHFTIADTKRAWLKLFPETEVNIQPAQAVKEVK